MLFRKLCPLAAALVAAAVCTKLAFVDSNLPRPDRKPADHTKKVQMFILLGQSHTLGCK